MLEGLTLNSSCEILAFDKFNSQLMCFKDKVIQWSKESSSFNIKYLVQFRKTQKPSKVTFLFIKHKDLQQKGSFT